VESHLYPVKEGQRYINLSPGLETEKAYSGFLAIKFVTYLLT